MALFRWKMVKLAPVDIARSDVDDDDEDDVSARLSGMSELKEYFSQIRV